MALQSKVISANGSKGHHKFALTVTENSTSVANNTSSVSWLLQIDAIQGGWDWYHTNLMSYSLTINGKTYSGTLNAYDGWSTVIINQDTISVAHGSDGKKTINYSFSISSLNYSYAPGSASASGSMTLTNIPRQATITSAPNFNDEANPTLNYSNPAGNSITSLQACISLTGAAADVPYREISKTGSSYTFNLTTAERNTLRNATTGNSRTVWFYIRTQIGSEVYFSRLSKTFSIVNADPSLTVDAVDINEKTLGFTGDPHKWIRHYSQVKVTATATAQKGATISKTTGTGTFNSVIKDSFSVTTTDSRGNSTTKAAKGTLIPYVYVTTNFKPRVTVSGSVTIDVNGNFYNGNFGAVNNVLSIQYRYKKGNGSYNNWTSYSGATKSNNTYSGTITFNIPNFDYKSNYTIQLHVSDKLLTLSPEPYTISAKPIFDWGEEDFNFNVPIAFNEVPMADFVVESGIKDDWMYRKWSSGLAECWRTKSVSATINTAWGSMYASGVLSDTNLTLPFEFAAVPVINVTPTCNGAAVIVMGAGTWSPPTTTTTGTFELARGTANNTSNSYGLNYQVMGRWK